MKEEDENELRKMRAVGAKGSTLIIVTENTPVV